VLLSQQCALVCVYMCNLGFERLKVLLFLMEVRGNQRLRYEWDLWSFVIDKFPEDGTLVPKYLGVDI